MVTAEQKDDDVKKPLKHIGEQRDLHPDLVNCASKIMAEAVQKFITESEKHSKKSQSQEFIRKVSTANENLTVTIDQLLIVAHRFESVNSTDNIKQTLCRAARDVLQGVIKVLLVVDDFQVQGLLNKTEAVITTLKAINTAEDYSQTKKKLAHLAVSVMGLRASLFKRTQNLISKTCSDQLTIWGNVLQSSMRVLHQVTKTCSQYPSNVSAKASYDSVEQEIIQACQKIKQLLTSGPEDSVDDAIINFVGVVDQLMDMLTEAQQGSLHEDAESNIVTLVQHSMSVAHCCTGVYREMIMTSCQRILQLKFRLTELNDIIKTKPSVPYMRSDFIKLCETALDEICDLEKHVTMALLYMIIEVFLSPKEKITKLRKVAIIQNTSAQFSDMHKNQVQEFIDYTENVCQVALLVASSSTDSAKVREIVTAVRNLESVEVDVSPAVIMSSRDPKSRASNKHLELVLGRWSQEVKTVIDAIDKLVDPRVFMEMTESILCKEVEKFKNMEGAPYTELLNHNYRVRNLVSRPKVIAEKLVDESADPIYRNGLRCFIKTLTESMSDADAVYKELLQTKHPSSLQYDTVDRRLKIVLQALRNLREGLDVNKHPHIMSKERLLFCTRDQMEEKLIQARRDLKLDEKDSGVKLNSETHTQSKGVNTDNQDSANKVIFIADEEHHKKTNEACTSTSQDIEEQTSCIQLDAGLTTKPVPLDDSLTTFPEVFKEKEREGGPAAEFYGLVKSLLIACISKDQKSMQDLTHTLLSWTNHIVENAELVVSHCPNILDRSELGRLAQELDKTASEVIHRSKFVVAGDMSLVKELLVTSVFWAQQLTRARLIIDVTTDMFMAVTNALCDFMQVGTEHNKNVQLNAINRSQKELSTLLTALKAVTGKYIDSGSEKMGFLNQSENEIENLTATIKTTVDVSAVTGLSVANDWWQFRMACRDQSVLMFCTLAVCEELCNRMEVLGQQKFLSLQNSNTNDALKTCDIMERETNFLLELVDCVVLGDATSKERSEHLVSELQTSLLGAWSVAKIEVNKTDSALSSLFNKLKFRAALSIWIEKAVDVKMFIRNNCFDYMGFPRQILLDVQNVSLSSELTAEMKTAKRNFLSSQLLTTSNELKQKVLKSLQLSPDLVRRTVIRSTLDDLAKLTTEISHLIREKSKISDAEVEFYTEQWGGKMKKLLVNLKKMDGIRQAAVTDLEVLNNKGLQGAVVSNDRLEYSQQVKQQGPSFQPAVNSQSQIQQVIPSVQLLSQDLQNSLQINHYLLPHPQFLPSSVPLSTTLPSHEQLMPPQPALFQANRQHVTLPSQSASALPFTLQTEAQSAGNLSMHQPLTLSHSQHQLHSVPRFFEGNQHMLTTTSVPYPETNLVIIPQQQHQLENDFLQTNPKPTHSEVSALFGSDRAHLTPAGGNVVNTLSLPSSMPHTSSQPGRVHIEQPPLLKISDSDINSNSPMGKSVSVLLKDAQYLGIRLRKWQEKMTHLDGEERSAVVHDALEMARLCSEMALFTKDQGPYKASSDVIAAAVSVVSYSKKIETFANRLHSLAGQCWLADHLKMCILKMNGCSSQLQIIATALHNSPKSHQGDRILVRNASSLLTTVRQMFALVESIAAMGKPDPVSRDELTNEIISLLVKIRVANESYLSDERKSSQIDELGLRRVELHNPPSITSSIRIKDT